MELTGKIKDLSLDFRNEKPILTLEINEKQSVSNCFDELNKADKLTIKIDRYKEKRSLDCNAYCWKLIGELSAKLGVPKEEIYCNAIQQVGVYETICAKNEAISKLCHAWQKNGLGWQTDTLPSKLDGCTNVLLYYGSSSYNKEQMNRLVNYIVDECKEQNIETRTPTEIAQLVSLWEVV